MRYRGIRLVPLDDPACVAQRHRFAEAYRASRGRESRGEPAHATLGRVLERGARSLVGERIWLTDRRVLAYQRQTWFGYEQVYKEIDLVAVGEDGRPTLFGEVKYGRSYLRAVNKACKQLRQIADVAGLRWEGFRRVAICMSLDAPPGGSAEGLWPGERLVEGVADLAALAWDPAHVAVVHLAVEQAWSRALERGWVDDPTLLDRVRDRVEPDPEPEGDPPVMATAEPLQADGSLAQALRKAFETRGTRRD